jgi:hypothetical protein
MSIPNIAKIASIAKIENTGSLATSGCSKSPEPKNYSQMLAVLAILALLAMRGALYSAIVPPAGLFAFYSNSGAVSGFASRFRFSSQGHIPQVADGPATL